MYISNNITLVYNKLTTALPFLKH